MRLQRLPANGAWAFTIDGEALVRLHDHPVFFRARKDAVEAARYCGLVVAPSGRVEAISEHRWLLPKAMALAFVLCAAVGCHGGSMTELAPGALVLHTTHGDLAVVTSGRPFDAALALDSAEAGFRDAEALDPRAAGVTVDGMLVIVEPTDYAANGTPAYGAWYPQRGPFHVRQGVESVMRYEVLHPTCWQLGRPQWCAEIVKN